MKYHHLSALDAVVCSGGIRAAARLLGVTQGAVTKAIRELEEDVGVSLIVRGAQGVTLTEFGRQLADRAHLMVGQMKAARDDVKQFQEGIGGTLSIGLSATIVETILKNVVERIRSRMTGVRIRIVEATMPSSLSDVRDGTLDFAIVGTGTAPRSSDLIGQVLLEVKKHIVCRPGHPLEKSRSILDLGNAAWVLSEDPSQPTDPMYHFFMSAGMTPPTNVVECGTLHAAVTLVASTEMISVVPDPVIKVAHFGQRLATIAVKEHLPPSSYALVRRASVPLSPVALLASDLFREYCNTLWDRPS